MECDQRCHAVKVPLEARAEEGGGLKVEGYAAVFNQVAEIGGFYREQIEPGAFTQAIGRDDVVLLINHKGLPLGRTRSGTLDLEEDGYGLKVRATLDENDPDVARIAGKMRRGDIDKMSFAFYPTVQEWDDTGDLPLRRVKEVELFDVSIVTTPAYDGTEIGLRSLEEFRAQVRANNFNAARMRLRMKQDLELKIRENG